MLDSDVDSWYEWKRVDNLDETHTGMNTDGTNDVRLINSGLLNHLKSKDRKDGSLKNGLIRYDAIPTSSRSGTTLRFINPAIYAETLNDQEEEEQEVEIRVKIDNRGDFTEVNDMMSTLSINKVDHAGDQGCTQETYRCYSSNSTLSSYKSEVARSKSMTSCRPSTRVERRCKIVDMESEDVQLCSAKQMNSELQRYVNGHRLLQESTSSLSIRISESRSSEGYLKKISYSEWVRRKQEAARRKKEKEEQIERKKQMEAERLAREKEERELRERENFLKWTKKKKREEESRKALIEEELKLQKRLKEVEDKTAIVKNLCLSQWARKKKEEEKARRKQEEMRKKKEDEEKQKRLEESSKAYENWKKMAKNKPRPATQGLLPHQKAKPTYVNPTPWQRIVEDPEDVEEEKLSIRNTQSQSKISKRNVISYD